jgi:hypothetical protein
MVDEQRFAIMRPLTIRAARDFHLKDAKVDPELKFFPAVEADNLPDFDGTRLMRPITEQ